MDYNYDMQNDDKKGAFDKLVAGLSSVDRENMLERINKTSAPAVQFIETENQTDEKPVTLLSRYKEESIFYKIYVWIRGIIYKKDTVKIYNEDILSGIAKKVDRNHPGIINHRIKCLDTIFYQRLKALKEAADFFKPYFSIIDENPGNFYVFLSSFVTPELSRSINENADPFILTYDVEPTNDVRNKLLKKLDEILKNFDGQSKSSMYYAVCSVNWLKQFVKLPYLHFQSQFTNLAGSAYTCPYKNACNDFETFASVFANIHPVQNEVLEAMLLFSQKKDLKKNTQEKDIERTVKEFLAQANQHFATIQMFISGVPIIKVGKVINENYDWLPGNIPGVEAWFPSFRSHWKKIIEIRWNDWIRERKKSMLSQNLKTDFNLDELPVMRYTPWTNLWSRVPFSYELTGGFVSWFVSEFFDEILPVMNEVMMEGVFIRSENRVEYSEGLNFFVQASNNMLELMTRLAPGGDYGSQFEEFATNRIRSFQVQNQIDSMMSSIESSCREIIEDTVKGITMMERVYSGIMDEKRDREHEGLQNYTMIKGHQNRVWRDRLAEIRELLKKYLFYIQELEPIDSATSND